LPGLLVSQATPPTCRNKPGQQNKGWVKGYITKMVEMVGQDSKQLFSFYEADIYF